MVAEECEQPKQEIDVIPCLSDEDTLLSVQKMSF
jgi:hypothetical protein